jgi:hypothetical protein
LADREIGEEEHRVDGRQRETRRFDQKADHENSGVERVGTEILLGCREGGLQVFFKTHKTKLGAVRDEENGRTNMIFLQDLSLLQPRQCAVAEEEDEGSGSQQEDSGAG